MASFILQNSQGKPGEGGERVFEPLPDREILEVEVVSVEERDKPEWMTSYDPEVTTEVSFRFRVVSGPYEKRNSWGTTPVFFNYSPKCRLRIWVQGILGLDELPEGFELKLDELAGRRCRVLVGNRVNKNGDVKDFVQDVFPGKRFEDASDVF